MAESIGETSVHIAEFLKHLQSGSDVQREVRYRILQQMAKKAGTTMLEVSDAVLSPDELTIDTQEQ